MKVLTAAQIREADKYTIEHEPISSLDLMERASQAFVQKLLELENMPRPLMVFAGMGNNGGDGLCLARMLHERGLEVQVVAVRFSDKPSADFLANEARLKDMGTVQWVDLKENDKLPEIPDGCLVIDALWGSGLSRVIEGWPANVIRHINRSEAAVVAVDIPSGLMPDMHSSGDIIEADITITFQVPKLALLLAENHRFVGEWHVVDIGLHPTYLARVETPYHVLEHNMVADLVPLREKFGHKGTYGHALMVAGHKGTIGAAILTCRAALRTGTGLVSVHLPQCGYTAMQAAAPEVMVRIDEGTYAWEGPIALDGITALGIGPGIGKELVTQKALMDLLAQWQAPIVLDADALNILARVPGALPKVPKGSILTPHPGEFRRLAGDWDNDFDMLENARNLAAENGLVVVLKGAHTAVCMPQGQVYFNNTGNPGMATAGSGDVLTGILTGLLAQGLDPEQAAMLGVYLHGLAGDIAAQDRGLHGLIASDIVEALPGTLKKILGQ